MCFVLRRARQSRGGPVREVDAITFERALATPATSAPVERGFSGCTLIATRNRNRMKAENVSLALFLNKAWDTVRAMDLQGQIDQIYALGEMKIVEDSE